MGNVTKILRKALPIGMILVIIMIIFSMFVSQNSNKPLNLFGIMPLTVLSNSMVPVFEAGDVIISRKVDPGELNEGDIISYYNEEKNLITHRIISIEEENGERRFYTKGDNNNTTDEGFITGTDIVGTEQFHIPKLGLLSQYTKGPMGFFLFIIFPLTGYLCLTVYEKMKLKQKQEELTK
jgi:signal peptidase I